MNGIPSDQVSVTLRIAREMAGLSREKAAKALKIKEKTLENYEEGRSFPCISVLKRIEGLYGVGYNRLIFLPRNFGFAEICRTSEKRGVSVR